MLTIDRHIIQKLDRPGPRYTSYPTAPEWSYHVGHADYTRKLTEFRETDKTLSLYVHIPFCETLCYFCACSKVIRRQDKKYGNEFIAYISKEINLLCKTMGRKKPVRQLHWGGGTPSYLSEDQMNSLFGVISDNFDIAPGGEIAVEVDPRRVAESKVRTLRDLGFNRISIGLQDFNDKVQREINRIQPFKEVEQFITWCRKYGFHSVNVDLIYGLPSQTAESFSRTVKQVVSLKPDRIALYSYAYVPWLQKHQQKMDAALLPDSNTKLDIFLNAREAFLHNNYDAIAMDHFALKTDELAMAFKKGSLYRNFMGYTVKPADEYIGIGPSAIGFLQGAFFQNYKTLKEYYSTLEEGHFPVERGKILSRDDKIRQYVIQSLMCHFHIDKTKFEQLFGVKFEEYFADEQDHIKYCVEQNLVEDGFDTINVTNLGKLFIRNVCMGFDYYLRRNSADRKFSRTV